jgi:arginine decarboxylase-like protein
LGFKTTNLVNISFFQSLKKNNQINHFFPLKRLL